MITKMATRSAAAFVSVSAGAAVAGIPVVTDEAAFLSMLNDPFVTEGYESYAADLPEGPRTLNLDWFDAEFNGDGQFGVSDEDQPEVGVSAVEGDQWLRVNFGGTTVSSVTFTFDDPVTAFGTYLSDIEFTQGLSVEVGLTNGQTFLQSVSSQGNAVIEYWGIQPIVVGIEYVTFTSNVVLQGGGFDGVAFDQTTIARANLPAPGSLALLGLVGLAGRRRR